MRLLWNISEVGHGHRRTWVHRGHTDVVRRKGISRVSGVRGGIVRSIWIIRRSGDIERIWLGCRRLLRTWLRRDVRNVTSRVSVIKRRIADHTRAAFDQLDFNRIHGRVGYVAAGTSGGGRYPTNELHWTSMFPRTRSGGSDLEMRIGSEELLLELGRGLLDAG